MILMRPGAGVMEVIPMPAENRRSQSYSLGAAPTKETKGRPAAE
jgi:hypothetical protein